MATKDPNIRQTFAEFCLEVISLGFEKVYEEEFVSKLDKNYYCIYAHRDGIILYIESFFWGRKMYTVNNSAVYFEWEVNKDGIRPNFGNSSSSIFISFDCRENITNKFSFLRQNGKFKKQWINRNNIWYPPMQNWLPNIIYDKLPMWVKEIMCGKE